MSKAHTLHVALPAMNEADFLPRTMECLMQQTAPDIMIWVCVNQPDHWWEEPTKAPICENNRRTLAYLHSLGIANLRILDNSSPGKGWKGKNAGVGQARKVLMDAINEVAHCSDIIVSLDADTVFENNYLECISKNFRDYPHAIGLSIPYFHRLSGVNNLDRAMLRYEIYMRHYAANLWDIGSPYCFTALGSAIALPVSAYRKIGGMTPKKSGEDFYLLQKLRKTGWLLNFNAQGVYPGTRFSDRVFFGTGPALIKGSQGNWSSYPIYHHSIFQKVESTYDMFPQLYTKSTTTPMSAFFEEQFRCEDIFEALRQNSSTPHQFIKACHHRIDGLRILQFMKSSQEAIPYRDEDNLRDFFEYFFEKHTDAFIGFLSTNNGYQGKNQLSSDYQNKSELLFNLLTNESDRQNFMESLAGLDFQNAPISFLDFIRTLQSSIEQTFQLMDLAHASNN